MPQRPAPMAPDARRATTGRWCFKVGDHVMTNGKAPKAYQGRRGFITRIRQTDGVECRVHFEDGLRPTTGLLKPRWLER